MASTEPIRVLIAGIGCSSLGIEIFKALRHAGGYYLVGADIDPLSFGLGEEGFAQTYRIECRSNEEYVERLLEICRRESIEAVAPGAQVVHRLLSENRPRFESLGILLMLNSQRVVDICLDKTRSLALLREQGVPVPQALDILDESQAAAFPCFPCVVKPSANSGGSNLVFLAEDAEEAAFFVRYLKRRQCDASLQEYIPATDEFTVGVLSASDGQVLASIALKRSLGPKLCYSLRYGDRVISSGWSQGLIDAFPSVCSQAEQIATALGSTWALNIQGRLAADGTFYPFEINPRHSGTTYLRALAGFNEPHILLQRYLRNNIVLPGPLQPGYYLRAFREKYLPNSQLAHT